jgi:hypothetical protein
MSINVKDAIGEQKVTGMSMRKRKESVEKQPKKKVTKVDGICQVCCESFNCTGNQLIHCPWCLYKACKSCHQRYILSSISTPHCMSCRNRWTYKNLLTLFNQSFVTKTFRRQRGQYLLDRSKSHLPMAMPFASVELELKILNDQLKPAIKEFTVLRREMRYNYWPPGTNIKDREIKYQRYGELGRQVSAMSFQRRLLLQRSYRYRNRRSHRTNDSVKHYEEPCPVDNCRGFIEKCNQRCGICRTFVCRRCTKILGKLTDPDPTPDTNTGPEVKTEPSNITTASVEDEELQNALDQIEAMERKDRMNDGDENMDENDEYVSGDEEETHISDEKIPDVLENDEKTLENASTLTENEKKELRKLKNNHECKQEDIDSVKEIRNHSRPCPSCKSRIFRISGCDTMWCTRCNTGFNWRTGLVITDARDLHNPHYIDFVRNNPSFQYNHTRPASTSPTTADTHTPTPTPMPMPMPTQPQSQPQFHPPTPPTIENMENPCDRVTLETIQLPSSSDLMVHIHTLDLAMRTIITSFQQQMGHVRWLARRKFLDANRYDEVEYALRYVTNRWDEKRWRIQVEHHDRFRQTNQEYVDVIMTWMVVMNDLFATHITRLPYRAEISVPNAKHFIKQMRHISEYTNNTLSEMDKMYKRKTIVIAIPEDLLQMEMEMEPEEKNEK